MSTIAVCMMFELGHILPTLRLAQGLRAAGHRVVYMTLPDYQAALEAQGFETRALLATQFPAGSIPRLQQRPQDAEVPLGDEIALAFMDALLGDEVEGHIRSIAPDLLLCDTCWPMLALVAHTRNIPCVRLSGTVARHYIPGIPPLTTNLPFGDTPQRRAAADQAWEQAMAAYAQVLASDIGKRFARIYQEIADRYGFSLDLLDRRVVLVEAVPCIPELILCAPAFDFPHPAGQPCHYSESLTLDRPSVDFPWHRLLPNRPLVFCALGSQSYRIPGARRFFTEVLAAAACRPDWQFVLALGPQWPPHSFTSVPDNAIMVPFAPQMELIERASVVITHAGMGTVKESIWFGVPMLAFPLFYDQPGNGARITHHGLGLAGDFDTVTTPELVDMLDRVHDDAGLRERMAVMRRSFQDVERTRPGLAFVEAALAAR